MGTQTSRMHIMRKIALLSGLSVCLVAGIIWSSLFQVKSSVLGERRDNIRHYVEAGYGILQMFQKQIEDGTLTKEAAQHQARDAIRAMKNTDGGYMFIANLDRVMEVHGAMPTLEGKSIYTFENKNDIGIVEKQIVTAIGGGGFFEYEFRKPNQDPFVLYPKIAYAKLFEPWGWIISSALYTDDIDVAFISQIHNWLRIISLPLSFLFLLAFYLSRTIIRPILALEEAKLAAEAATRAKSDFLANMSHEIRTPINSILGISRLVTESAATEELRNWGAIIFRSGENLLQLISDIMDLTKIESSQMKLEEMNFDLCQAVSSVTDLLLLSCQEKGIELIVHFDSSVPQYCFGDAVRFKQILTNLIGNAVKFTETGYVFVSFRARRSKSDKFFLWAYVQDTGIGIPPEKASYIFEKFSQAEESSTRKFGGTGLGLAITNKLAPLMGGHLKLLRSALGKGSVFSVILPLRMSEACLQPLTSPLQGVSLKGLRALIVDNAEISCEITKRFLETCGLVCQSTTRLGNAQHLLDMAKEENKPYDFIILDYKLDDGHALVFSKKIKEDRFFGATSVVLLTAFGHFQNSNRLVESGINAFLVKPFFPKQFEIVLQLLRSAVLKNEVLPLVTHHTIKNMDPAQAQKTTKKEAYSFPETKILVVDDMPVNRMIMTKLLDKYECLVSTANNGLEAIDMVREVSFDLVFMDCQMPEMDGYVATMKIREQEATGGKHTPIVALTADAMTGDKERCLAAGMDDYLYKPFKPEQIAQMIKVHGRKGG